MPDTMTMERIADAQGAPVYDAEGDKIGAVEEIFYDVQSNEPKWVGIGTGFFGTKRVLVPLESAQLRNDGLTVPYAKDHVKDAPDIDEDEISESTEQELYAHYQLGGQASGKGRKGGQDEVTRSEEELRVGKRTVDAGGVRLRKWVETEDVDVDVELKRETARVTREPIDEPVDAELSEEEIEVSLRAEEPVAEKQVIGKERVSVEKEIETDTATITDEVRKERVEVEGDADER
ncbi:MAG: PRC and DUF2382 domain-containing protein [Actinobacteria bacterium]|nr:PRC and DUF2382 domain-containing protein [Actinomycetota bacterium]